MVEYQASSEFMESRGRGFAMDATQLKDAISQVQMDASNVSLTYEDGKSVALHLKEAAEHLANAESHPDEREDQLRWGFASLGKARGILGRSSVQSPSYRRHQWPFLPPEADPLK